MTPTTSKNLAALAGKLLMSTASDGKAAGKLLASSASNADACTMYGFGNMDLSVLVV